MSPETLRVDSVGTSAREQRKSNERPPFSEDVVRRGTIYEHLYEAEHGFLASDHPVTQELERLLMAHPGEDKPSRVRISYDTSAPNAFVLPNGTIVINRQLLSMLDIEEMKVVIAHETTHHRRRDVEEFRQVREEMIEGRRAGKKAISLVGRMRMAEWRADVQGVIEGDEAGTHPAALRALMQKLERWERERAERDGVETGVSLLHGREIERMVNAGMAAQVYDFSTEYQARTAFSQDVRDFCMGEAPPRFLESSECEAYEAHASFQGRTPLEVLQCIRLWREGEREEALAVQKREEQRLEKLREDDPIRAKEYTKQLAQLSEKPVEIPLAGEGYVVAREVLDAKIRAALPSISDLQREALVHFLFDSSGHVMEDELIDSPMQDLTSYFERIETREDLSEIAAILVPETFKALGIVFIDGEGISRFTGALFRTANEAGIFEEGGKFDAADYLQESRVFMIATRDLLEEQSLTGRKGFTVSKQMFEELLLNIDVRRSHVPVADAAIEFQRSLLDAGLPVYPYQLLDAVKRQHYAKGLDEELEGDDIEKSPDFHKGGTVQDRLMIGLYTNLHPFFGATPVWKYAEAAFCPGFPATSEVVVDGESKSMSDVRMALFGRRVKEGPENLFHVVAESKDASSVSSEEYTKLRSMITGLAETLCFPQQLQSLDDLGCLCEAMNQIDKDMRSLDGTPSGERDASRFARLVEFAVVYLFSRVGEVDWLPSTRDEAIYVLLETIARFPGPAVSDFLMSEESLNHIMETCGRTSQVETAFRIAKIVLNHDGADRRDPEVHARGAFNGSRREDGTESDDLLPLFTMLKGAYMADESEGRFASQDDFLRELQRLDEFIFTYRTLVPLSVRQKETSMNTDEDFARTFLRAHVHDLALPVDRKILLSLASHLYDPVVRSRIVRTIVRRELVLGGLSVRDKIDLLWKNPHVRSTPLGDTRERVIDEEVQTPEDLAYLRECVLQQADHVVAPERMGVYALLERLEQKKDAFELFRIAYEYSEDDTEARRELFLLVRQDWTELGFFYRDEHALIRTETLLQNLEASEEVVKHAFIRKMLIGERGLLHSPESRRKLFGYLLESAVDLEGSSPELLEVVREVLDAAADQAEADVLFMALAPFLQERLFLPAKKRSEWQGILAEIYSSTATARETVADLEYIRRIQAGGVSGEEHLVPIDQLIQAEVTKLGIDLSPEVRAEDRPTLETMVVRIAESIGADGVRFLQVLGQYVEDLPPHLEQAFQNANDNVRGQPKLTACDTINRRAPQLRVRRLGKRLGGGSLMSPYDSDVEDPMLESGVAREALKVLAPNVEYFSDVVEANLRRITDSLVKRNPDRYDPARRALEDISAWIRADVRDSDFFHLDPTFRKTHGGFQVPGIRYGMYIPESRPVGGDPAAPANRYIKREEFVDGVTLNKVFRDSQGHDIAHATALIAKVFAQQLVSGVMHSDIHPGNYMLFKRDGKDFVAMIDRSMYLELDERDQALILGMTQEGVSVEVKAKVLQEYFQKATDSQDASFWYSMAEMGEKGSRGVHAMMAKLRQTGFDIPLKLTLLLKNVSSMNRMCQRAGFSSFREALGYVPDVV